MVIEGRRLRLRRWRLEDAAALFRYASDRRVSEPALWPAHSSVEMSRDVIREVLHLESLVITAGSRGRNTASQRVAEKCGFSFEKDYVLDGTAGKVYRLHGF